MKFSVTVIACLILLGMASSEEAQADQAYKNWSWSTLKGGASAQTISSREGNAEVWILFYASRDCMPEIVYAQAVPKNHTGWAEGPINASYQLRVDKFPVWTIPANTIVAGYIRLQAGNSDYHVMSMDLPVKMLGEIVQGNNLRLMRTDNAATDRFSLSGSAFTLRSAYRHCESIAGKNNDPDLRYFNQGTRNNPPASQPGGRDPDREYFR